MPMMVAMAMPSESCWSENHPAFGMQGRFETIFHESVLGVDFAGHVVLVKCYSGMANAACEVFDALKWKNVVGTLSGDDTFLIVARSERDAKTICSELTRHIGQK